MADAYSHWRKLDDAAVMRTVKYYARVEQRIHDAIADCPTPRPSSVLDIGIGGGHWIRFFHDRFGLPFDRLMGIDIAPQPIEHAILQFPGVGAMVGDLADPALQIPGSYDVATAIGVLHHIVTLTGLATATGHLIRRARSIVIFPVPPDDALTKAGCRNKQFWRSSEYIAAFERSARENDIRLSKLQVVAPKTMLVCVERS
jgi:2-polyprenyl-3-methyl-5-hydroxy-6-metoxy-1,4-benzoquinol methylase